MCQACQVEEISVPRQTVPLLQKQNTQKSNYLILVWSSVSNGCRKKHDDDESDECLMVSTGSFT